MTRGSPEPHRAHAETGWVHAEDDDALRARVRGEFREMPGLRLTLPQAARLFSLEPSRCERILRALVLAGDLATDGKAFLCPRTGRRSA